MLVKIARADKMPVRYRQGGQNTGLVTLQPLKAPVEFSDSDNQVLLKISNKNLTKSCSAHQLSTHDRVLKLWFQLINLPVVEWNRL